MRAPLTLLALLSVLALPGCDTSPTAIDGGDQVFQGTVPFEGNTQHALVITRAGGVRIEVESIVADPPLAPGITPSLGFGLGEPNADGECRATFQSILTESSSLAFGLQEREYCLFLADNGTFAEGSSRTYSIVVSASS